MIQSAGSLHHTSNARQVVAALVACLTVATGCPSPVRSPLPTRHPVLQRAVDSALAPLDFAGTHVGLVVMDAKTGEVLLSRSPDTLVAPASTQKILTISAVLERLDGNSRLTTRLLGAAPDASGSVEGDLWLVGDGDPSFGSGRGMPGAVSGELMADSALQDMAVALKAAGVQRVRGSVVGDGRAFGPATMGAGWSWDDAPYDYSSPLSGLTYLENSAELRVRQIPSGWESQVLPPSQLARVGVVLAPSNVDSFTLMPGLLAGDITVWWPANRRTPAREFITFPDPPLYAAEQLTAALVQAGITVAGAPKSARLQDIRPSTLSTYAAVQGQPLRQLCGHTLRDSRNLHAELLLQHLGRATFQEASTRAGLAAVQEHVRSLGHDPSGYRVVDGSGLSRMNLLSPGLLVDVLRATVQRHPEILDMLPVAGGPGGTLEKRLVGTPAQGRVRAKTGTLTGHRNLVGVVDTVHGRRLLFALLLSGVVLPRVQSDAAVDATLLELVKAY